MKAINQSTAPKEKNQNSRPAHKRCVIVARAKTVKNVCVRIAHSGRRKTAKINFTHRVGTSTAYVPDRFRVAATLTRRDLIVRVIVDLRFIVQATKIQIN